MEIRHRASQLLSQLTSEEKEIILEFLLESQILEYGITYILTGLPFLKGPKLEDISGKPLGGLINELEKTKDSHMLSLAEQAREFNDLRINIIHGLIHMEIPAKELVKEIITKIKLARRIQDQIDQEFDYIYQATLDMTHGSIF